MRVAITGASGSLGRALMRRLTGAGADRIVAFSRDEARRAALLADFGWHPGVRVFAGDVRDAERLPDIFHGCDTVIHAAARKVVSAHPDEPREMLLTNVLGTMNVIAAARAAGVRRLLFISSDKGVEANNVYGTTKSLAEYLVISGNAQSFPTGLRMSVARYGNVLASRGSVLEAWRRQVAAGLPLQLSDARMTRFWLTLGDAADIVMRALADLRGGEIFVPKLSAAPLTRLAEALVAEPAYEMTGIRPGGEKLHESLLSESEVRRARDRNGFYVVPPFQGEHMWDQQPWLGEPVPADLLYRSDVWHRQLSVEQMREMVKRVTVEG